MESRELPVVVALATVSASLVLAFGRVFESSHFVAPVLAAALLPHVIGAVTRWRRASGLAELGATLLGLTLFVVFIVPGTGSPSSLMDRLSGGWHVITTDSVPIRTTPGAVLLVVLAVWLAAAGADDLAFRRQASLGALAPGLMVLIWIAALGTNRGQWLVISAFGATSILFLALQHQALLDYRRTLIGNLTLVHAPRLLVVGAVAGLFAIVFGVVAATALPGGDKPLFETGGPGSDQAGDSYQTSVPPLLNIGAELKRTDEELLFTVDASRPDYWRIVALDEYRSLDGGQWTLKAEGDTVAEGLEASDAAAPLEQRYTIEGLDERWMPAAYEPVQVSRSDLLVVRSSSTLVTLKKVVTGLRYTVVSDAPAPDVGANASGASTDAVPSELRRFTELPGDFPASVIAQAEQITQGADTPLEKAQALRDFFRDPNEFVYDPTIPANDTASAIELFLTDRRGFCVQFASAYATMARAVGIPSRVAVGFTPGTKQNGVYEVTNFEAHAWPEVWLGNSIGWTHAFDPTPPSDLPGGSNLPGEPDATPAPVTPVTSVTQDTTGGTTPDTTPDTTPATTPDGGVTVDPTPATPDSGSNVPWLLAVLLAAVILVLAPVAIVVGLKASRRSKRRARTDPAGAIAGAWAEVIDDLSDRQVSWPASATPLEVADHVPSIAGDATAPPLRALADAYGAVRYGETRPTADAARDAWRQVDTLHRALDTSNTALRKIRARLDPTTLRRPMVSARRAPIRASDDAASLVDQSGDPDPAGWSKPRSPSTKD
ncbi:MAG: DUF4129 domain-containing protein [Acidimicrobiia bacterium]|nr:DUF4129 domain-containing protein [Acidimicrobiia bacterium]